MYAYIFAYVCHQCKVAESRWFAIATVAPLPRRDGASGGQLHLLVNVGKGGDRQGVPPHGHLHQGQPQAEEVRENGVLRSQETLRLRGKRNNTVCMASTLPSPTTSTPYSPPTPPSQAHTPPSPPIPSLPPLPLPPLPLPPTHSHVGTGPNKGSGKGVDELTADSKVAQLNFAPTIYKNIGRLHICVK